MTLYVTPADRARETATAKHLATAWRCTMLQLPASAAACDYLACRNTTPMALVEMKQRTTPRTKYATYIIDQKKVDTLNTLATLLGLAAVLVVTFTDAVTWLRTSGKAWPTARGGRVDRADPSDIDVVYHIPVDELAVLT